MTYWNREALEKQAKIDYGVELDYSTNDDFYERFDSRKDAYDQGYDEGTREGRRELSQAILEYFENVDKQ